VVDAAARAGQMARSCGTSASTFMSRVESRTPRPFGGVLPGPRSSVSWMPVRRSGCAAAVSSSSCGAFTMVAVRYVGWAQYLHCTTF